MNFTDFTSQILISLSSFVENRTTLAIIILLGSIGFVMMILLMYILSVKNYLTNSEEFFKRRFKEMKHDGMITDEESLLIPVIHGRQNILPLEPGELLFFYQKAFYHFFRLNGQVRNVNIDLLLSEKESIDDFEKIGKGRVFFTSKMLIFENVRSRNKILWSNITEIKVKFEYLILFDTEGCHAFLLENPEILSDFIYNVFLKKV